MKDIPKYSKFTKIEQISTGISSDHKYYIETSDNQRLLLRISDISEYEKIETVFNLMKRAALQNVPMCVPIDFGLCNEGKNVYQLLTWCDGKNLEAILPTLSESEQYMLGIKAGEILHKIHNIPAPDNLEDWAVRYMQVNEGRIKAFTNCNVNIKDSNKILSYFDANKHLLNGRPQCLHHGDYHIGNFLITNTHDLFIIDWELLDYQNYGDPWEEFNRIGNTEVMPYFTTGLIRGYFGGEPPEEFWRLLSLYLSAGSLMLVTWAFYLQKDELDYCVHNVHNVLQWFNNMNNPIPTWYLKDINI